MPVGLQDRIGPHAALAAPDDNENTYPKPSLRGASYATWQSLPPSLSS